MLICLGLMFWLRCCVFLLVFFGVENLFGIDYVQVVVVDNDVVIFSGVYCGVILLVGEDGVDFWEDCF